MAKVNQRARKTGRAGRSSSGAALLSEFGAVVCAIAILIIVPLMYVALSAISMATISFYAERSLTDASEAGTFEKAVVAVSDGERRLKTSGICSLLRARLVNGKTPAMNLYVVATDERGNNVAISQPNSSFLPTTDKPGLIFSYRLDTTFEVLPLTSIPTQIPLLSQPVRLTMNATRTVEHCDFTFKTAQAQSDSVR